MDFKFTGIDELSKKLKTVSDKAPERLEEQLDEMGDYLKGKAIANTPRKSGKLQDSWKLEKSNKIGRGVFEKKLVNKAPHSHLVEYGHDLVLPYTKKKIDYVKGVYMLRRTIIEEDKNVTQILQKNVDEIFKELME